MAKIVSQISVDQRHELLAKLEAAGLTGQLAQKVIESRDNALAKEIVALIHGTQSVFPGYTVSVDYDCPIEQLVKDGKYYWSHYDITTHYFPSTEKGEAQIKIYLMNFGRQISSEDAIREMATQGLRPATLKELLVLGATQPELQCSNPIVALGSTWRDPTDQDVQDVPYLDGRDSSRRILSLFLFESDWNLDWRFAAVRKELP